MGGVINYFTTNDGSIPRMSEPATKFKAEEWTATSDYEVWAVTMLDGDDAGWPCAFGPKEKMEKYAEQLNASQGVLR